ncbi:MAG: DUF3990 domain-containing protein [Lachnospiraceae bacterium]|nr:DUF3990 domain-containing protein [Lachnospiraceae bacterium]
MILYHGSKFKIEKPEYHKVKPINDYGYGFYCTEYPDLGREWSVGINHDGCLNIYDLDTTGLSLLDLNEYGILTWLSVLLENRKFELDTPLAREAVKYIKNEFGIDYKKYDLIKGYRADDSYFSFAWDFINGVISFNQLSDAMYLRNWGNQIVLKSLKSFEHIKWISSETVEKEIWLPQREKRDSIARNAYHSINREYIKGDLYIVKIIDEEIKKDDARLQ